MEKLKNGLAISIIPQVILVNWFAGYPELVEKYYSEGIYPIISTFLRTLFGWVPFSMGDVFYTILVISVIRYLYINVKSIRKEPKRFLRHIGMFLSLAYFFFYLFWGMNYYRLPINEKLNFKAEYTTEDLVDFTYNLANATNYIHYAITKDHTQPVKVPYSTKEIYQKTLESYETAAKVFPNFEYKIPSIKSSLYSLPLTYMGYGGYINPFTNEAQVNAIAPSLRLPSISAHEIGHQLGYSSESATNFIGLLITRSNTDIYFKYAAHSHALAYCLSDLRTKDEKAYNTILSKLSIGIKKNYQELNAFWAKYENPTEPIFKAMFDTFLKANNQQQGIQSYNAVVGLLVNSYEDYWFDLNLHK